MKSAGEHLTVIVGDVKHTAADATGVVGGTQDGKALVGDLDQLGDDGKQLLNDVAFAGTVKSGNDQDLPVTLPPPLPTPTRTQQGSPASTTADQPSRPPDDHPSNTPTSIPNSTGNQAPTGSRSGDSGNGDRAGGNGGPIGGNSPIGQGGGSNQTTGTAQPVLPTGSTNSVGGNSESSTNFGGVSATVVSVTTTPDRATPLVAAAAAPNATPPPQFLLSTSGSVTFVGTVLTMSDATRGAYPTTLYHTYTPTDSSSPSPTSSKAGSSNHAALIGGVVGGVIVFLVLVLTAIICLVRKRRAARKHSFSDPYPFCATNAAFSGGFQDSPPASPRTSTYPTLSDPRSSRLSMVTELPRSHSASLIHRLLTPTERKPVIPRSEPDAFLAASRRSSVSMGMAIGRWSSTNSDVAPFRTTPDANEKEGGNERTRWSGSSDALSFHTTLDLDEEKNTLHRSFSSLFSPLDPPASLVVLKDPFIDPEGGSLPHHGPSVVA